MQLFGCWPEFIDEVSRQQGARLRAAGFGPIECAVAFGPARRGTDLARLHASSRKGPVVLIVPAPIKKAYIWDLAPGQSAVRQLVNAGAQVYLVFMGRAKARRVNNWGWQTMPTDCFGTACGRLRPKQGGNVWSWRVIRWVAHSLPSTPCCTRRT